MSDTTPNPFAGRTALIIRRLAVVTMLAAATPATAQDIALGLGTAVTSLDPHFHNLASNIKMSMHIFEPLVDQDERQRPVPDLASAWRTIDDTTWEFTLRRGVRFHDGQEFGAEDVAATLRRVPWVPNSPNSFVTYTRAITETIIVDPYTVRFRTASPYPLLPNDLSSVEIISRRYEHAPTADFNNGQAAVGTGPFRFVAYLPGDRVTLQRNDAYWGVQPHWQNVTLRVITNQPSRVAALLANDVQAIDDVPPSDLAKLRSDASITVLRGPSNSVLFLHMDQFREQTPFATDRSGAPLPSNPFRDRRVRMAISKAINRAGIVERVMEGAAVPAASLLADGFFGSSPRLKPDTFDPEAARRLLTEAGYPNGFGLTIHGPIGRYVNDNLVLQAIAPMLVRIGIDTKVVVLPWATFIAQASAPTYAYSMLLIGNSATTGEASFGLRVQFATVDPLKGMGGSNRARYSNPLVDGVLGRAMATIDDTKREALLQEVSEIAMHDQAIVPLFHQENIFAVRRGLQYTPRTDGYMAAYMIRPAN
jgi:peptide/nickel transport system substrate-binding protein